MHSVKIIIMTTLRRWTKAFKFSLSLEYEILNLEAGFSFFNHSSILS